ncbi:hypothetical protein WDW37_00380 [Bdellovibrionota bacterium FG-1]
MRLVEFLILMLQAHAHTLQRLAALFGEEILLHMLEESGEELAKKLPPPRFQLVWFEAPKNTGFSSPYAELEGAVHDFTLPAMLEFHLWAYPHYRSLIESTLDLNARIPGPHSDTCLCLIEEALEQANAWIRALPIATEFQLQAQSAAQIPWLRFRTQTLKQMGRRPFGAVIL